MGEGKGQAGHMALDQERPAHEFWEQWKDKHPCYCGTLHSRDCYMKFASAYAVECVRAERKRCLSIAKAWGSYEAEVIADGIAREEG